MSSASRAPQPSTLTIQAFSCLLISPLIYKLPSEHSLLQSALDACLSSLPEMPPLTANVKSNCAAMPIMTASVPPLGKNKPITLRVQGACNSSVEAAIDLLVPCKPRFGRMPCPVAQGYFCALTFYAIKSPAHDHIYFEINKRTHAISVFPFSLCGPRICVKQTRPQITSALSRIFVVQRMTYCWRMNCIQDIRERAYVVLGSVQPRCM